MNHLLKTFLDESKIICLHSVKCFDVLQSDTSSFIWAMLNGSMTCSAITNNLTSVTFL